MPADTWVRGALRRGSIACGGLGVWWLAACSAPQPVEPPAPPTAQPTQAPAPAPAPAPEPVVPPAEQVEPADLAARHLLAYDERLRQMSAGEVAAEVNRLGAQVTSTDPPASADVVLALALALAQQHNPGDLARAATLLEPLVQDASPEPRPWQALARLLAGRIAEERRLEDELERQAAQRRDTQRTILQLTEKLEALKAIERSMTSRPGGAAPPAAGTEAPAQPRTP